MQNLLLLTIAFFIFSISADLVSAVAAPDPTSTLPYCKWRFLEPGAVEPTSIPGEHPFVPGFITPEGKAYWRPMTPEEYKASYKEEHGGFWPDDHPGAKVPPLTCQRQRRTGEMPSVPAYIYTDKRPPPGCC
ncbi:MAG: hypothetical protein M1834_005998 [Cirrosporium novae-zelandiae]|nr:MAG: hypothetical protein M1834_005998 [Cirrosporium novae-zelandiae]